MPASAIYFLDVAGRVILSRDYRGDVPSHIVERFVHHLGELEEQGQLTPVVLFKGFSFVYIQYSNLYVVASASSNANVVSLQPFLHKLVDVFKNYFGELEEESLRDNFVIIYELLDEVMDFGYPQFTEAAILQEYIKTDAHKLEGMVKPPMAVTNAVSWRSEGIKYKKNEVFLDVVEKVNMLMSHQGQLIRGEVLGALKMKAFLSGMPECKLGLNDKVLLDSQGRGAAAQKAVELEDIKFHQCVRLAHFEKDRTISFIPPDGQFDLMTYRITGRVKPLIQVECEIERHGRSRTEYMIRARTAFKARSTAHNLTLTVPLPIDCSTPESKASTGNSEYHPEQGALMWKIKSLPGGREALLRVKFGLPTVSGEEVAESKRPIQVNYEIPYFTVSGMQVRYLKVIERSGYQALPWVRYITTAGEYEVRMM